jgi:antitoxin CptB
MLDTQKRSRLEWHCRRGMLELDLILQNFLNKQVDTLTEKQLQDFDILLDCTDPELFAWLMGHSEPQDKELLTLVSLIRTCY